MKQPVLSAICEFDIPKVDNTYLQMGDLRNVQLTFGFMNLEPRDQLIVVKACIRTHMNILKGMVPAFGKVIHYELFMQSEDLTSVTVFNTSGKLLSSTDTTHENPLIVPNVNYDLPN